MERTSWPDFFTGLILMAYFSPLLLRLWFTLKLSKLPDQIRLHFSLGITKKTLCHTQLVIKQPHKTPDALLSMRTVYCGLLFWEVEAFSLFQCVYRRGLFWKSRSDMRKWRMSLNFVKKLALAVILPEVVQIKLLQKGFSFSKRWDHIIQSR